MEEATKRPQSEYVTLMTPPELATTDPDADVLDAVQRSDMQRALRQLMQRHGFSVYGYCREALRDAELVEGVHQQVFVDAFHDLANARAHSTVRTWLFKIVYHRVLHTLLARPRQFGDAEEAEADLRLVHDLACEPARFRLALVASLAELDQRTRSAVLLHYQQGFTLEDTAEICGEEPGRLGARIAHALPRLWERIASRIAARLVDRSVAATPEVDIGRSPPADR